MGYKYITTKINNQVGWIIMEDTEGSPLTLLAKYILEKEKNSELSKKLLLNENVNFSRNEELKRLRELIRNFILFLIENQGELYRLGRRHPHKILDQEVSLNLIQEEDKHIFILHNFYEIIDYAERHDEVVKMNYKTEIKPNDPLVW